MFKASPLSFFKGIIIPIILWIGFTPYSAWLDFKTSQFFYHPEGFVSYFAWDWIYSYAIWPAWIVIGISLIGLIFSFFSLYHSWRKPCIYLLLTLAIGSGLVIHACLKDHWGRPRPRQTIEFGGTQPFQPYYQFNHQSSPEFAYKSFACGHASMGFYFFALALLGTIYRSSVLYWIGWSLGWSLGIALSLARIAQGGHFLSDTIASALIMWLTAWLLAYFLFTERKKDNEGINA